MLFEYYPQLWASLRLQLGMLFLLLSCSASPSASAPAPTALPPLPTNLLPTPTPFQPGDEGVTLNQPGDEPPTLPTFTPYPTKYVNPQENPVSVETTTPSGEGIVHNPLTGLPVDDPAFLQSRPLAIKVGNAPDYVRPQSGLTLADVVYEYYIEWGDTRFIAVFWSNSDKAGRVGPVRSGRYFDEHITRMYHSFLFFKGADPRELDHFYSLEIKERFVTVGFGTCPPYFMGPYSRDSYNNVFLDASKWKACAQRKGFENGPQSISGGFFSEETPQSPLIVTRIFNYYSEFNYSYWQYDAEERSYVRYQESKDLAGWRKTEVYEPLYDDYTRKPVTAENVVVLFVPYIFVNQNQAEDEVFNPSLIDYGNAYVFRDGVAVSARWSRTSIDQPILLTDLSGAPIYLRPGQTFYEVMGVTSKQTQDGIDWRFEFATP